MNTALISDLHPKEPLPPKQKAADSNSAERTKKPNKTIGSDESPTNGQFADSTANALINRVEHGQSGYQAFLKRKVRMAGAQGFEPKNLNPALFGFQRRIVEMAVRHGRYAPFT